MEVKISSDIQKGLENLLSANSSMVKIGIQQVGDFITFQAQAEFFLGRDSSKKLIGDLKLLSSQTTWTFPQILRQFRKNRPTDFKKWSKNIKEDINLSSFLGMDDLGDSWQRRYFKRIVK